VPGLKKKRNISFGKKKGTRGVLRVRREGKIICLTKEEANPAVVRTVSGGKTQNKENKQKKKKKKIKYQKKKKKKKKKTSPTNPNKKEKKKKKKKREKQDTPGPLLGQKKAVRRRRSLFGNKFLFPQGVHKKIGSVCSAPRRREKKKTTERKKKEGK